MDVLAELQPIGALYKGSECRSGLEKLDALWDAIPEPKTGTLNAYLVVEYGAAFSLKCGDLDQAQKWANRAPMFAEVRHDMGEAEFLVRKVAFARDELDLARQQFVIANKKSDGRAFQGKDERYRKLIR